VPTWLRPRPRGAFLTEAEVYLKICPLENAMMFLGKKLGILLSELGMCRTYKEWGG